MILTSARLTLRPFRAGDAQAFAAYRSDPEVARYQGWDTPYPVEAAERMIAEMTDPAAPGWFQYAVDLDGALIGDIGVNTHENLMQADIGYTLAPAHQGRGLAFEAVGRVVRHLFEDRGLRRVSAECDARNERSVKLLKRLGFRQEGHRVENTWIKGEWTDDLLFGLLAKDFHAF
ncbi:GNAT family N-acetyltransferase [Lentzea guizhouensis]|uniref:GNAT family N-acetyltransferase n=1 Tax=Lentzea guizhouensis TaxID=1586287 RepID=A0A1B2HRL1_9PSEU|nr:GNAT family protein [Lentzea guizhouensis]ANZ40315.1 GNAT family N-acetyltransferase [Lentzea guizhouensis]